MIFRRHFVTAPKKKQAFTSQAGFSLVELMVTLGIVILATGLVMIKYASFNSSVLLNSLAYQIAFDIREAQSLGISVRGNAGEYKEEYGIYFKSSEPNQYKLFQDNKANGIHNPVRYNETGDNEMVGEPIIIDPRFTLVDICGDPVSAASACGLPDVSISFARPDFNAVLYSSGTGRLNSAEIKIGPGDGTGERIIEVTAGGMITVKSP